jgi:glutamate racemase
MGFDIKAMVIACNTVCSVAYDMLASIYDIPVYEVVSTPSKYAASITGNRKIGVIGTAATIRSNAYEAELKKAAPELYVISVPCPLFVPLAENGRTDPNDIAVLTIAGDYFSVLRRAGVDTLIMGCTHYPLLRGVISRIMGPGVALVDSGAETAKLVAEDLRERDMLSQSKTAGTIRYFVTDSIDGFSELASRFLESDVRGTVQQVTLE